MIDIITTIFDFSNVFAWVFTFALVITLCLGGIVWGIGMGLSYLLAYFVGFDFELGSNAWYFVAWLNLVPSLTSAAVIHN